MKWKTGKLVSCLSFLLAACNSGDGSGENLASYSYTSGPPYNLKYNLINPNNIMISGDSQQPTLTCNLGIGSRTCSVIVQGTISLNGGGYISPINETAYPVVTNEGVSPCPQNPRSPNVVNCTLSFTYQGNGTGNIFMQTVTYSLVGNSEKVQMFLPIIFYSPAQ